MTAGLFVVLEGLDGAGTTTQVQALAALARKAGRRALCTREPSDGPVGTLIRQALTGRLMLPEGRPLTPHTLALLFAADRADHLASEIDPALDAGAVVFCDRYVLSSVAYQGLSSPPNWVEQLNAYARTPDLTLFLDVDSATAAGRRAGRGGRPELFEDGEVQARVRSGYRAAVKARRREERIVRIDGTLPVAQVTRACWGHVARLLAPRRRSRSR